MQFSSTFKQLCKEKGVTQKQALEDMGMGRNATQRWNDGVPALETLIKISSYFGVTIDRLIQNEFISPNIATNVSNSVVMHANNSDHVSMSTNNIPSASELSEQEQEVLRIFRALDMRRKNTAMNCLYDLEDEIKQTDS